MSPVRFWQRVLLRFRRRRASPPLSRPTPQSGSPLEARPDEALQSAVERLVEDETLTADLRGPAARHLLDWGIARATAILQETGASAEESQARLAALRQQMRAVAHQVGQMPADEQVAALQRLLETGKEG